MAATAQGTGWQVAQIDEIPPVKADWPATWKSVRHFFGITAFGVNAVTKDAGNVLIPEHDETASGQQELPNLSVEMNGQPAELKPVLLELNEYLVPIRDAVKLFTSGRGELGIEEKKAFTIKADGRIWDCMVRLHDLALNLRWTWDRETRALFRDIYPSLWDQSEDNPLRDELLRIPQEERRAWLRRLNGVEAPLDGPVEH